MSNGFDVRGRALQDGELAAWLAEHSLGNRFGLAVDATEGTQGAGLAIVAADGDGRYIRTAAMTPDDEAALVSWLADPGPPKAIHDLTLAMHALSGRGWTLRGVTSDTVIAANILRPARPSASLNDLLVHHMRCALPASSDNPEQGLILRACAVLDLADVLDEELARVGASSRLSRVELPAKRVLAEMQIAGVAVDRDWLTSARATAGLSTTIDELLNSIAADGRIHTALTPDALAPAVREAIVAGSDYLELMAARYCELEQQVETHLALDAQTYTSALLGSPADIVKAAIINVDQVIRDAGLKSRLLLHVDDELLFEVAAGERNILAELVREQMRDAYSFEVPLEIALGFGPNWAAAAR